MHRLASAPELIVPGHDAAVFTRFPAPGAGVARIGPARPETSQAEAAVRAVERSRFDAMIARDVRALDTLLADDLTYTHTTGRVDDKRALLADLETGRLVYDSIVPADVRVRVYGHTAAVTGTARMQVRANGTVLRFSARFTELYVDNGGRWRLAAWQSTRVP
jgi:hypothetical protein